MAREISLTAEDLKALESKLKDQKSSMSPEELNFTEHLVRRATEGQGEAQPQAGGVQWTWTYRF